MEDNFGLKMTINERKRLMEDNIQWDMEDWHSSAPAFSKCFIRFSPITTTYLSQPNVQRVLIICTNVMELFSPAHSKYVRMIGIIVSVV